MPLPRRETPRLRWGRYSEPSATYFVTTCTKLRRPALIGSAPHVLRILAGLHASHDAAVHAATVMPDHVHLLLTLGARLRLGQLVAKFKSFSRDAASDTWRWQDDFFERRVRADESSEAYALYIFMNPYRAGLLSLEQRWPWWYCPDEMRFEFPSRLAQGKSVPAEWIGESRNLGRKLRRDDFG